MEFWYLTSAICLGLGQRPFDTFRYVGPWGLVFEEFRRFDFLDREILAFDFLDRGIWTLEFGYLGLWGFGI